MQSKQSVYLRIVSDTARKIELGLLQENERLPSCRELAFNLGINPNTVQRAYSTLEESGYIYTQPKKGVYVAPRKSKNTADIVAKEKLTELKDAGISKERVMKLIDEIWNDK